MQNTVSPYRLPMSVTQSTPVPRMWVRDGLGLNPAALGCTPTQTGRLQTATCPQDPAPSGPRPPFCRPLRGTVTRETAQGAVPESSDVFLGTVRPPAVLGLGLVL